MASNLKVGDSGEDIARLHDRLASHGIKVSAEDRKQRFFGPSTRAAVRDFQLAHGIDPSCEVCMATAARLEAQPAATAVASSSTISPTTAATTLVTGAAVIAGMGAVANPPFATVGVPGITGESPTDSEPTSFVVRGTVTVNTSDGQPFSGALVYAFEFDLRKEQWLGKAVTDERGQYLIRYGTKEFATGDVPLAPMPKLIVRAFAGDQQIGKDVTRPKSTRDEVVNFIVPAPVLSEWEKLFAGVIPLLAGQGEGDQMLPPWEINDSDLNFIAEETGLEREQIRLWALAFAVGRDTAIVMQSAGVISAPGMAMHALPDSAIVDGLSTFAIFYGWFRLGIPTEPVPLWATPTETLLATLSTAITQGIVPSNIGADLGSMRAQIEQIKLDRVLQTPTLGTTTSLGDLLATLPALLNLDQQRAIAAAVTELRPDDLELVKRIAGIPGFDGDAVGVARTLRLGALTGAHVPLVEALQHRLQFAEEPEGTLRPLAMLRRDEWHDLVYTHGTPNDSAITLVAYADALAASVELQYPTAALAAHVTTGRRLAQQPLLADVGTFLRDNPDFDIVKANLNVLEEQAELGGVAEPKQLVAGLRALQRMHVLNASWEETATLLDNDLYSPQQLLATGPGQLTALLDGQLAPERITALYRQAETLQSTTLAVFTAAFSPLSGPQVLPHQYPIAVDGREINPDDLGGLGPITIQPQPFPDDDGTGSPVELVGWKDVLASGSGYDPTKYLTPYGEIVPSEIGPVIFPPPLKYSPHAERAIADQPTLQALFGNQDACACGHCNSVLSPAAYFVDVLQFIKNAGILDGLLKRRPGPARH